jgi:hypothetical protein
MNHYKQVIESIEPLLSICIKMADRIGNDEIRFSKTRAKELLRSIHSAKKLIEKSKSKHIRREPSWIEERYI